MVFCYEINLLSSGESYIGYRFQISAISHMNGRFIIDNLFILNKLDFIGFDFLYDKRLNKNGSISNTSKRIYHYVKYIKSLVHVC